MKKKINNKFFSIDRLHQEIEKKNQDYPADGVLFGNYGGNVIYYMNLYTQTKNEKFYDLAINFLKKNREASFGYSFCSGQAGQLFLLEFLKKYKFLNIEDEKTISKSDYEIFVWVKYSFKNNQIDFLHEGLGALYYFIYKYHNGAFFLKDYLHILIDELFQHFQEDANCYYWNFKEDKTINLGVSHGIISLFYILSFAYSIGLLSKEYEVNLKKSINFIIDKYPIIKGQIIFPPSENLVVGFSSVYPRLAWCYGDLGNSVVLKNIADFLDDNVISEYALELALNSIVVFKGTYPNDASICHGLSGIAIIYKRLYQLFGRSEFLEISDYWYKEIKTKDMVFLSSSYVPMDNSFVQNITFLEGLTGTALVLLSESEQTRPNWADLLLI